MKFKNQTLKLATFLFLIVMFVITSSCKKEQQTKPNQQTKQEPTAEINKFIYENTSFWYLWNEYIPSNLNYKEYSDPNDLFEAMMYRTSDCWSYATENYNDILNNFNGIVKTAGYKLLLFKYFNIDNLYGVIEYVYEGGPAAIAGMKRGDIIIKVNGQTPNTTNYNTLFSSTVMELGMGRISGTQMVDLNTTVPITKVQMSINPVLQYQVIDAGGKKIGYLLYEKFIQDYFTNLEEAISYLNAQSIDEMVLDLRYNGGGYISTCAGLASMLAPSSALNDVFLKYLWNDLATDSLTSSKGPDSKDFIVEFPAPSVNLNLSQLVVLTSKRTASASEGIINGLKPYMDVIIIGDTTVGKYTAGSLFYDAQSTTNKWGMYLIMNKLANSDNEIEFVNGFAPDYLVHDDFSTPLGNVDEPLLAKAIEVLTGIPVKKETKSIELEPFARWYDHPSEQCGMMIREIKSIN